MLSFGDLPVPSGIKVSPNAILTEPVLRVNDTKSDISLVLYDKIANYLHYFKYNDQILFPYIAPTRKSQYLAILYNSTNLAIPIVASKLVRENFSRQIASKELGKVIEKVSFDVNEGTNLFLNKLSPDLLIDRAIDLTVEEIRNLCKSDPSLKINLCESKEFLRRLISKYLTSDTAFARQTAELYSLDFVLMLIEDWYEYKTPIAIENIGRYFQNIEFFDLLLHRMVEVDRYNGQYIYDKLLDSINLSMRMNNKNYKYTLMMIPKIFTNNNVRIELYRALLNSIVNFFGNTNNKTYKDDIIMSMGDELFNTLLTFSLTHYNRSLYDTLISYVPVELAKDYVYSYDGEQGADEFLPPDEFLPLDPDEYQ